MQIKLLFLSMLLFFPLLGSSADQALEQLHAFLDRARTLRADFKQVAFDENGNAVQTSYGVFTLQRPGRFRWDYEKPFVQQIVSNSDKVWFYDADLEQVTVRKLDESIGSTPALLLSGKVSLEENFSIERQGRDGDLLWIRLLPRDQQSSFKYILIGMDHGVLAGMELSDNFGQLTRIYFSNVRTNVQIDPTQFEFIAPEGTDIFQE